ncbi:hypothetical protein BC332_00538 [Capsicum chinense]|nr:hypothetical protein FXO37_33242 [Capsicum annuum]PHU28445.1 hypothetical protein BC332_00538 [Capsicum chinense]
MSKIGTRSILSKRSQILSLVPVRGLAIRLGAFGSNQARLVMGARTRKPGTWCVANWFVSDEELKAYLDEKCQIPNVCRGIQPGKPCFEPNETHSHASYILNNEYKKHHLPCPENLGWIVYMNPCKLLSR